MSAVTVHGLCTAMTSALSGSSALASWATTNLAASLKFYNGLILDSDDTPGRDEAPFVAVHGSSRSDGLQVSGYFFVVDVICAMVAPEPVTVSTVTTMAGKATLEQFCDQVWGIVKEVSANIPATSRTMDLSDTKQFPLLSATMRITYEAPRLLGGFEVQL